VGQVVASSNGVGVVNTQHPQTISHQPLEGLNSPGHITRPTPQGRQVVASGKGVRMVSTQHPQTISQHLLSGLNSPGHITRLTPPVGQVVASSNGVGVVSTQHPQTLGCQLLSGLSGPGHITCLTTPVRQVAASGKSVRVVRAQTASGRLAEVGEIVDSRLDQPRFPQAATSPKQQPVTATLPQPVASDPDEGRSVIPQGHDEIGISLDRWPNGEQRVRCCVQTSMPSIGDPLILGDIVRTISVGSAVAGRSLDQTVDLDLAVPLRSRYRGQIEPVQDP
jgi:hypothetical protein